jgi:general secretion pathway protein I
MMGHPERIVGERLVSAATRLYFQYAVQAQHVFSTRDRSRKRARGDDGFTLVEVIVAIAILSVGLSVTLGMTSGSVRQLGKAKKVAEAGALAQSLLARVGTELHVKEGESNGQFPNGYAWRLKISKYGDAAERERWPVGAYVVSAQIEWEDHEEKRDFALTTLRLGAKEAAR